MSSPTPGASDPSSASLSQLVQRMPGLQALALVHRDARVVGVAGVAEDKVRALTSFLIGVHDLADRITAESGKGSAGMTLVSGDTGNVVVYAVGSDHLLLGLAAADTPVGLLVHDVGRLAKRLADSVEPGRVS